MQRRTTTEAEAAVVEIKSEIEIEEREKKKIALATEGFTSSIRRFGTILRNKVGTIQ